MQNPKGDGARPGSTNRSETCRAVVADLSTVIEQVRKSLKLIESEIASEASSEEGEVRTTGSGDTIPRQTAGVLVDVLRLPESGRPGTHEHPDHDPSC